MANVNYKQISIAYSNYILTKHTFVDDFINIIQEIIIEYLKKGKFRMLKKYLIEYTKIIFQTEKELNIEFNTINNYYTQNNTYEIKKNIKRWEQELKNRVQRLKRGQIKFFTQIHEKKPNDWISNFILKQIFIHVEKKIIKNEKTTI